MVDKQRDTRCQEVLNKVHAEIAALDARKAELKHVITTIEYIFGARGHAAGKRIMSPEARERIAEAQRERWRNAKRADRKGKKSNGRASNAMQPGWKGGDDDVILSTLKTKSEPQDAPEFARSLMKKLPHRSEGAIRQRLGRLADAGVIKQKMGDGINMTVEAA